MATQEKVLRISQLDSLELDTELNNLIIDKFFTLLIGIPNSSIIERLRPEIKSILKFFIWKWSLGSQKGTTFGQQMMSLQYKQQNGLELSQKHKWLLLLLYITPGWISDRLEDIIDVLLNHSNQNQPEDQPQSLRNRRRILNFIKGLINICSLFNFCSFLLYGRYPSLKERILRLETTPVKPQTLREFNFVYMNREILWYGFSEFLFTVLPLINFQSLRNSARRLLHKFIKRDEEGSGKNLNNFCVLCEQEPTMPQLANCGHIFCYYCIAANVLADRGFTCPFCNQIVTPFYHYCKKYE